MAQPQIIRKGGSINGPVSIGRIHWAEPIRGTVTVKDGTNAVLATLFYSGSGICWKQNRSPNPTVPQTTFLARRCADEKARRTENECRRQR
jgi:hypothetical protein